ncbi:MAG: hypothetical protein R2748_19610 [Bryobacterales bacterium]
MLCFYRQRWRGNSALAGRGAGLAALTGLHPIYIYWADQLVSDLAFMALGLGAVVRSRTRAAARAAELGSLGRRHRLVALARWTRTLGATFVAGVAVVALLRHAPVKAVAVLAGAAPVAWGLWTAVSAHAPA